MLASLKLLACNPRANLITEKCFLQMDLFSPFVRTGIKNSISVFSPSYFTFYPT